MLGFKPSDLISQSGAEVIFRSQVTPDIRIDLAEALKPPQVQSQPGVLSRFVSPITNWFMRSVIRPEIQINAPGLALHRSIAPFGKPENNYTPLLAAGIILGVAGTVAAGYYFTKCKKQGQI